MARSAKVESLDAIKQLRTFLPSLERRLNVAIEEADYDIQSTLNWLKHEQYPYWKGQLNKRNEEFIRAKLELNRKKYLEKSPIGGQYSYIDQKKALARAQHRLEQAREMLDKISKWVPNLEKEIYECRSSLQGLANMVQIDLLKKRTQIDQMIYSLEAYIDLAAPSVEAVSVENSEDLSQMSRPIQHQTIPDDLKKLCGELRERNPLNKLTLNVPIRNPENLLDLKGDQALEILESNILQHQPEPEEVVIYDNAIESYDYIYAVKIAEEVSAKMHVYIGTVRQEKAANYSSISVVELMKQYPDWKNVLLLPESWLVIFKEGSIFAVFDADDNPVYSIGEQLS